MQAEAEAQDQQPLPFFLRIPIELRLQIYEYAILSPRSVTISGTPGYWERDVSGKSLEIVVEDDLEQALKSLGPQDRDGKGAVFDREVWVAEGFREDLLLPDVLKERQDDVSSRSEETNHASEVSLRTASKDPADAVALQSRIKRPEARLRLKELRTRMARQKELQAAARQPAQADLLQENCARKRPYIEISPSPATSSSPKRAATGNVDYYTGPGRVASHVVGEAKQSGGVRQSRQRPAEGVLLSPVESLHLTCRQIHSELVANLPQVDNYDRNIDLYVSYPAGVTILADHYLHVLKQTKNITILGLSTLDDHAGTQLERVQDMKDYIWESVDISPKDTSYSRVSDEDMLARHQINSLASVIARLLGKIAFEEEQEYRDHREARAKAAAPPHTTGRRLSFSSIPRESTPPLIFTNTSGPSTLSIADAQEVSGLLADTPSNTTHSILTIDPPPPPTAPRRKRSSSPAPPFSTSPTLHLRTFHPRMTPRLSTYNPSTPNNTAGPPSTAHRERLQDPYTQVWSHVFSPITIAMSNIYGGHIALSVARGDKGVGIAATVKGNGGMGRQVSSRWPVLEKGDEGRGWLFERKLNGH